LMQMQMGATSLLRRRLDIGFDFWVAGSSQMIPIAIGTGRVIRLYSVCHLLFRIWLFSIRFIAHPSLAIPSLAIGCTSYHYYP